MNMVTGCEDKDSTEVMLDDFLTGAQVSTIDPSCFGDSTGTIVVESLVGGYPPYQYSLDGVIFQSSPIFEGLPAGSYTVIIQDSLQCEFETVVVIQEGIGITLNIGPDLDLVLGDSVQLQGIVLPPGLVDSLIWDPDDLLSCTHCFDPVVAATEIGMFWISAIAYAGDCIAIDSLLLNVEEEYTLWVPNVFSPNDDNINDWVTVFSNDELARVLEFEIFDRWGEKVFKGTDFPVNELTLGWDGVFRGQYMNPAVFVYVAKVQFRNGQVRTVSGDITLVR
jgi:gliding motility-associated-like protein